MSTVELRDLHEQKVRAMRRHPSLGKQSVHAHVKLGSDVACEARLSSDRVTRVDLPADEGGTDTAPTPGDLMRASLGACLAMGYRTWAALLGVELQTVEVDVTCEFDARGQLGVSDDVPVGWQLLLLQVRIVTNAPVSDVHRVVEQADRLSPMLANLSPAISRAHALTIQRIDSPPPLERKAGTIMTTTRLLTTLFAALLALISFSASAAADPAATTATRADIQKTLGFMPQFFQKFPEGMLPGAWEEMKGLQLNPNTALDGRSKELIGLAVAAQVPCRYCIVAHTEFGKLNGASETELGEAVAIAAITRHWSTFLNGMQTDETRFRAEIAKLVANVKQAAAAKRAAPAPLNVTDGASAVQDMTNLFGFAPEFLAKFPEAGRAGAWKQFRDVQLSPKTALSGKTKELLGLAVASQVPCRFCIIAHTEFAKLNGASDLEIREAIAVAALTRNMSTLLNGLQVDEPQFRRDVDRLVKNAKAAAKASAIAKR